MWVKRKSALTGITKTIELPVTSWQLEDYYVRGFLVQEAFPNLSPSEREFILTGIVEEEWNQLFGYQDE